MNQMLKWLKTIFIKQDKYKSLRHYPIFKELSSFELYLLNNYFHSRSFKTGEVLFDKNYPLEVIYFIEKGEIEIEGPSHPSGKSILKKHQFLGMMDMFHENIRSSKATAITEVEALAISRVDLMDVINKNPKTGVKILSGICRSFSNYIFRISANSEQG